MKKIYISLLVIAGLQACTSKEQLVTGRQAGFKPIYSKDTGLFTIRSLPARPVANAGKIYAMGTRIYQADAGNGIHVLDNSNPQQLRRTGFIQVHGCDEIAIRGNFLYSNNFGDLVVIDISNPANAVLVKRLPNAFYNNDRSKLPPQRGSYFECVDESKGKVIGWMRDTLINPTCRN